MRFFFGHLALEKLLKALIVAKTKEHASRTHNLIDLAAKAKLSLSEESENDFIEITTFNISTRYPEERLKIYKKTKNPAYAKQYFQRIKTYAVWLKKEIQKIMR